MNKKLTEKLWNDFPLLYKDNNSSIRNSLIPFGFPGDGWEPLIRELSEKLELLIQKYIKENPDLPCSMCGCEKDKHYGSLISNPRKCLSVHKHSTKWIHGYLGCFPKFVPYWFCSLYWKIQQKVVGVVNWILSLFYSELYVCFCEKYDAQYPRASQVKEKYGYLNFYMTSWTDEISELIDKAEEKSATICEDCGKEGKLRDDLGWILTLCDKHYKKQLKKSL